MKYPAMTHPSRLCSFLVATLLVATTGCTTLMHQFNGGGNGGGAQASAPESKPKSLCSLDEGQQPYLPVPYGDYAATGPDGSGKLKLNEDHTFVLSWNTYTKGKGNARGRYQWFDRGVGIAFEMCDVRLVENGRADRATRRIGAAVTGFNDEENSFTLDLSKMGRLDFAPQ